MAAAWTQTGARSAQAVEALTETEPALSTDGVSLADVASVIPVLHAPVGQTFTGVGSLLGYKWTGSTWVRAPRLDYDLSEIAGLQDGELRPMPVDAPRGRLALIASGVTLSGAGATVTLELLCTVRTNTGVA
jgi:hypothetical protein